jgi:hypothetical protein
MDTTTTTTTTKAEKQVQRIDALKAVVQCARNFASMGAALTAAAMAALLLGCDAEDVITAARGGYQEAGEDLPSAWASNLRRVAAAGRKHVQAVLDSDRALNNRLLDDVGVPKTAAQGGRPKGKGKAAAKGKGKAAAKGDAPSVPNADPAWRQFLEALRAQVPSRKDWMAEDIVAFQDCASRMIALIQRNAK